MAAARALQTAVPSPSVLSLRAPTLSFRVLSSRFDRPFILFWTTLNPTSTMVSTRLHAHVARAIERRAPDAVADASTSSAAAPAATATTSAPVTTIPNDPTALIAVIAVLATIILGEIWVIEMSFSFD
jgi:hypothetical protein